MLEGKNDGRTTFECDLGRANRGICLTGCEVGGKSAGIPIWVKHGDWGTCGECAQADKIIEMIENNEEKLL